MPFTKWTRLTRGFLVVSLLMAAPSSAAIMPLLAKMMPRLGNPAGPAAVGDDARPVLAGGPSPEGIDTEVSRLRGGAHMYGSVKVYLSTLALASKHLPYTCRACQVLWLSSRNQPLP